MVWAWGASYYSLLGIPSGDNYNPTPEDATVPQKVPGLKSMTMVVAKGNEAFALTSAGIVWAWGNNGVGQLGSGSTCTGSAESSVPTTVKGVSQVSSISAGDSNGYAIKTDGTVWTWGWAQQGMLGDPAILTDYSCYEVRKIPGLSNVNTVIAGVSIAFAIGGLTPQLSANEYVALGDSYSSGEGNPLFFEPDNSCHRSEYAYSTLINVPGTTQPFYDLRNTPGYSWGFLACSGAKTSDVLNKQLAGSVDINNTHDATLNPKTKLVTISIGGNDVQFANVLSFCEIGHTDCANQAFGGSAKLSTWANAQLPILQSNLVAVYKKIHSMAPNARIIVVGYPQLLPATTAEQNCAQLSQHSINNVSIGLSQNEQNFIRSMDTRVNATIKKAVSAAGVGEFVPVDALFAGHEVCGSKGGWINGPSITTTASGTFIMATDRSFHPTITGQSQYANAINAHLKK